MDNPFSSIFVPGLFPLEILCQMIYKRRVTGCKELPAEQCCLQWFDKIQTQLPGDITLPDPWVYPDQGRPVNDTFRQRAWALLSLVDSQICLPDTVGSVFLRYVNIIYKSDSITLEVSKASDSIDTESITFPKDLHSGDGDFDVWLRKAEVLLHYSLP